MRPWREKRTSPCSRKTENNKNSLLQNYLLNDMVQNLATQLFHFSKYSMFLFFAFVMQVSTVSFAGRMECQVLSLNVGTL